MSSNSTSSEEGIGDDSFMIIAKAHLLITSFGIIGNAICIL